MKSPWIAVEPPTVRAHRAYRDIGPYDARVVDVPPALLERARAFLGAGAAAQVAAPRHAATVVLLRDTGSGPEVYLLRRAGTMAFAAGMHVFPGGSVDPRDGETATAWAGPPAASWAGWLGCDEPLARALVCAAVRETFEESGVLLAGPDAGSVVADTTGDDLERDRLALLDRSASMAGMLAGRGLVLRSDLLRPWAHWITPEFEPKRFDTRFFVAAVPPGQRPRDVSGEADDTVWLPVSAAVTRHEAGELEMLPPTIECLRELAGFATVSDALAAPRRVRPVMPRLVSDGDRLQLLLDDE
jgi:8-oxo-dGTP pyrophosphatase MutT (NUDIX family)